MAKGITIDLIVDPKGAIEGLNVASDEAGKTTSIFADLGKIGATAVVAVATAAVAAATALAGATVSAGKYADEILQASTNTNISTETLQAYKYAAEQMDVSFDTFVSSQGKFTKSMATATAGTGPAAEAFAALGLSVTDSSGNLVDSEALYWQSIDALGAVTNETERTALAQQLFGKSGAEMNSIIAKGSEGFAALSAEAEANGAIMSGSQLDALGKFDDKMEGLTSTVEAAKNALGLTLLPVLDQLAGDGKSALGTFTKALLDADGDLSKAGPAFETLGTNVAEALTTAVPKILQVGTSLVSGLVQGIVSQGPTLIQTAIPLLLSFVTTIMGMLPSILDAGLKIVIALVQGIADALPTLIPAAIEAVLGIVDALIDNLPLLLDAGVQLLGGLTTGLLAALPKLIAALPVLITSLLTFLVGAIPTIIEAGIELFLALIGALPDIITGLVAAIPQIITGLLLALVLAQPKLINAGIELFIGLIGALPEIISALVNAVPQIINGLISAFSNPTTLMQFASAGQQLIYGLWDGISSLGGWLWNQVSGFFTSILDGVKSLFGIHSPSTVFAGFGGFMIKGLEKGLTAPNHLDGIMSDLSKQVTGGFGPTLAVSARASFMAGNSYGTGQPATPLDQSTSIVVQGNVGYDPESIVREINREKRKANITAGIEGVLVA